jgi:hypothetical protein
MYMRDPRLAAAPAGGSPPRDRGIDAVVVASLVVGVGSFFAVDKLIELGRNATEFLPFPF